MLKMPIKTAVIKVNIEIVELQNSLNKFRILGLIQNITPINKDRKTTIQVVFDSNKLIVNC
jgi:hypothetical protein